MAKVREKFEQLIFLKKCSSFLWFQSSIVKMFVWGGWIVIKEITYYIGGGIIRPISYDKSQTVFLIIAF